jgi:hypothetical protein
MKKAVIGTAFLIIKFIIATGTERLPVQSLIKCPYRCRSPSFSSEG